MHFTSKLIKTRKTYYISFNYTDWKSLYGIYVCNWGCSNNIICKSKYLEYKIYWITLFCCHSTCTPCVSHTVCVSCWHTESESAITLRLYNLLVFLGDTHVWWILSILYDNGKIISGLEAQHVMRRYWFVI